MNVLKESKCWKLVNFGKCSNYKVINNNKCYYESQQAKRATEYFNKVTAS